MIDLILGWIILVVMKSIYIVPLSFAFLVFGLLVGYLAKEVYDKQKPKDSDQSTWLDEINAYQDDDFLHSFQGIQENLSKTEKLLGQKLITCIGEKKIAEEKIETLSEEVRVAESAAGKSFINRFLGGDKTGQTRSVLSGKIAPMYGSNTVDTAPMKVIDQRYRQIFPNVMFQHPKEDSFGFYAQSVADIDAFLDEHVIKNPNLSVVDMQRKKRSRFFQTLKAASFEGRVDVFTEEESEHEVMGKLTFRSPAQFGNDWILVTDDSGNTLETRTIAPTDQAVWRYNSQNPSVALLSEQCYWNDQYVYEYKDFFYLSQQAMLVANIYCKKQNATTWDRVGTLKFEQVSD